MLMTLNGRLRIPTRPAARKLPDPEPQTDAPAPDDDLPPPPA